MRLLSLIALLSLGAMSVQADNDEKMEAAEKLLKAGKYPEAEKAIKELIEKDGKVAVTHFLLGEALAGQRKHADAIKAYETAYELDKKFLVAIDRRGGERFKLGMVKESIEDFDRVIKERPKSAEDHWRRGISLYYIGRFQDGADQFKLGDRVYANDVENAFWHWLCLARADGAEKARKAILTIGKDGRIPMMKIYDLIRGKCEPKDVLDEVEAAKLDAEDKNEARFYGNLYLALYYEAIGQPEKCLMHLTTAVEKHKIGHYMWDCGNVHLNQLKNKKK